MLGFDEFFLKNELGIFELSLKFLVRGSGKSDDHVIVDFSKHKKILL